MNKMIRTEQLKQLIRVHFLELIREPGVLFWGIVFPVLMSLGLGIAFTGKPDMVRLIAIEAPADENGARMLQLMDSLTIPAPAARRDSFSYSLSIPDEKLGNAVFYFRMMDREEALVLLKRGEISIVLGYERDSLAWHFDPANSDAQLTYLKLVPYFSGIPGSAPQPQPVTNIHALNNVIKPLTVAGTRYIDFLVPGIIAMGVMMSCMWGISYGIIEKRSKKLLRRMVATPMRRSHFLVSLITVRLVMNIIEAGLLFLFTWMMFGIMIQGSVATLITLYVSGNIAFAGVAVLISSHTSNTEIGNGMINAVVMPMMVLSGIFFSYHHFPGWSIPYIRALPLTMLADGIRSIFIEGSGFKESLSYILVLSGTGFVFFAAGLKMFKWH